MHCIQHILNTTGITPDTLAGYVGLSRQALLKASMSLMSLDTSTLLKLSRLQESIESAAKKEKKSAVPTDVCIDEAEQEKTCRYRAVVLKRKLDKYESNQKKYTLFLQALELFQPADEEEILWKQKTKRTIIKKLDKCGVAICMGLRKQVYLLETEADYIIKFQSHSPAK